MRRKFEVLQEDTGCDTKLLRGYMERFGAYLNIEVPLNRESSAKQKSIYVNLSTPYSEESLKGETRQRLEAARRVFDKALMGDVPPELYPGKFEKVEIDEEDYTIEYTYDLAIDMSGVLGEVILDKMGHILDDLDSRNNSSSKLEQLLGGRLDEKTLEGLTKDVDAEMRKVTLQTGSTGVVDFISEGDKGYGKISTNQDALENEHDALTAIRGDGLVKVLAPVPIGLIKGRDAGVLFTWGTENQSMYNPGEVRDYFSTFNTLLFTYAHAKGLNLAKLARDTRMQDVFNRALINSSGISFSPKYERPEVAELEELKQRAGANRGVLEQLGEFDPIYRSAAKKTKDLDPGKLIFTHGDARPENVGKDPYGVRPMVDWANAHMGTAPFELASLESPNNSQYTNWYNFVADFRGGQAIRGDAKDLVICHDVMQPYRTATFKASKGRLPEIKRDVRRLRKNAQVYKERFGD